MGSQRKKYQNGFEKLVELNPPKLMPRRASMQWQSEQRNMQLYWMLRNQITALYLNRFKWINLPNTCDEKILELLLFTQGQATIAANPEDGLFRTLQIAGMVGELDEYGYPYIWEALGLAGNMRYRVTKATGMYVYDNSLRVPILQRIEVWTHELVDILTTLRQDRAHLKIPVVISGLQEKKLDMENYVKQVAGGEIFMITTNGIDNFDVKVQNTQNTKSFQSDLWASYFNVWNEIYKSGGIEFVDYKKERRVEAEIEDSQEPSNLIALDSLSCRRQACDYLNEHIPYFIENPIDVVWNCDNISSNYKFLTDIPALLNMGDSEVKDGEYA